MFFAATPFTDAMTQEFSRAMSTIGGLTIDRPPSEVQIAGRRFSRVDFSGVRLFRSMLIAESRCHFVNCNLTAKNSELLANLLSLNRLRYAGEQRYRKGRPDVHKQLRRHETYAGQSRSGGDCPCFNSDPGTDCNWERSMCTTTINEADEPIFFEPIGL
jgi:hypothetical protein